jgi:hypothetical protein
MTAPLAALLLAAAAAQLGDVAAPPTSPPPPTAAPTAAPTPVTLHLTDGQALRALLVATDPAGYELELAGVRLRLPAEVVRRVDAGAADPAPRDPNRTRYLYSPSAFMLRRGEGYLSQTELAITSVAVGATDWLTLMGGTVLPVLFYDPTAVPFVGSVKVGGPVAGRLRLAAGAQALVLPALSEAPALGFLFATATLGDEDLHASLSAGPPFSLSRGTTDLGELLVSLSGAARLSPRVALVSENWLITASGGRLVLSGAVRFIADRLGVDAGLVWVQGTEFPLPWLDFTWHWR